MSFKNDNYIHNHAASLSFNCGSNSKKLQNSVYPLLASYQMRTRFAIFT